MNSVTIGLTKIVGFTLALGYSGAYVCNKLAMMIISIL